MPERNVPGAAGTAGHQKKAEAELALMSESELVLYYGLSVGAGLVVALIIYAVSEYLGNPSRFSVFAWLEPSASEHQRVSISVDNQTGARAIIHEAGAILEDGRHIRIATRTEPANAEPPRPFPLTVTAHEQVTVTIFPVSRQDVSIGLAACYVIRDRNKVVTGPVHGQLD